MTLDPTDRQRQVERLHPSAVGESLEAIWLLARSGDPEATAVVFALLDQPDGYPPEVVGEAVDGLVAGAPKTLPLVQARLTESPFSPAGRECARVLGEVGYRNGLDRNPGILPVLLRAISATLDRGVIAAAAAVAAVRECARTGPIPEADGAMCAVLATAATEVDPYIVPLDNALAVLYINQGDALLPQLCTRLASLPRDHGLADAIRTFLAGLNYDCNL